MRNNSQLLFHKGLHVFQRRSHIIHHVNLTPFSKMDLNYFLKTFRDIDGPIIINKQVYVDIIITVEQTWSFILCGKKLCSFLL